MPNNKPNDMPNMLQNLLSAIDNAIESDNLTHAARLILANWSNIPDTAPLRERTATILASAGHSDAAVEIYERVATHYAFAGLPTRSLAVIKQIHVLQPSNTAVFDLFAELYCIRSPHLSNERPQSDITQPENPIQLDPGDTSASEQYLFSSITEHALDPTGLATQPSQLPALTLLSLLPQETLRRVLDFIDYDIFAHKQPVISPEQRTSELSWTASADMILSSTEKTMRLPAGTLLGLNAFGQAAAPPEHTIMSVPGSELLRLSHTSIARLCEEFPDFLNRLTTLRRHALTEGLLCRHELFSTLSDPERIDLASSFIGLRIAEGEQLIAQNHYSPGLYIVLDGTIDIRLNNASEPLTTMGAGDVIGEISLINKQPAMANATMTTPGHVLFLSREDFYLALQNHPSLASYTSSLATKRQIAASKQAFLE